MKEYYYDKLLHIKTSADKNEKRGTIHYHPYEPTEYRVLEVLLDKYPFNSRDSVVDFGSGKGRLCFFIHYYYHATVKGVEMNESFYEASVKNKQKYIKKLRKNDADIQFYCCLAEEYEINRADNRFYFFNPFSEQIFMRIVNNILLAVGDGNRDIELILYYPSDDYVYYLETKTPFQLKEEITIPEMYDWNPDERFLIYYLP